MNKKIMRKIAYFSLALVLTACGGQQTMPEANNEFAVMKLETTVADLNTSYPATIKGIQDVEIRPKVSGHITRLLVDEGDFVRAGQPLFIIDETQFRAAVKAAEAQINVVKANISTSELTLKNKKMLLDKQIISQYDYDMAENQLKSLKAQLAQAEANLVTAKDNLRFCTVSSPAAGVVGTIPYRVGSLVSSATAEPLTTVSNISEMYAYFSMTEKQLLTMTRNAGGTETAIDSLPAVKLIMADGTEYPENGKVTAISGVITQNTGAVQIRATFNNKNHMLRSGGTGSILIPMHNDNAIQIPQKATFDIQNKKFVYVLSPDSTVHVREIEVLTQNDGTNFIVSSGLTAGETIVIEGVNTLKEGVKISPISKEQSNANRKKAEQALKDGKMPGEN